MLATLEFRIPYHWKKRKKRRGRYAFKGRACILKLSPAQPYVWTQEGWKVRMKRYGRIHLASYLRGLTCYYEATLLAGWHVFRGPTGSGTEIIKAINLETSCSKPRAPFVYGTRGALITVIKFAAPGGFGMAHKFRSATTNPYTQLRIDARFLVRNENAKGEILIITKFYVHLIPYRYVKELQLRDCIFNTHETFSRIL